MDELRSRAYEGVDDLRRPLHETGGLLRSAEEDVASAHHRQTVARGDGDLGLRVAEVSIANRAHAGGEWRP